jgi:uncharacterized protein YecT (DUF1311 family)
MKFSTLPTFLTTVILFSTPAMANPASPPSQCEDAGSTGLTYQCFQKQLKALDVQLTELLHSVPATAADVPSQQFRNLWMEHLQREGLDRSNVTQLMNFQQARHAYCSYVNSIAFQGTGYGSLVLKCEIELTQAALKSKP